MTKLNVILFGDVAKGFQVFSLARQAAALVVSIVLAKSSLSTFEIGVFETWLYLGLLLTFLCFNGSFQAMASSTFVAPAGKGESQLFNIYFLNAMMASFFCLLIYFTSNYTIKYIFGASEFPRIGAVLLYLWLHLSSSMTPYIFLLKEKKHLFFPYALFYFLGYIAAISIPLILGNGIEGLLIYLLFFAVIEHVILMVFIWANSRLFLDLKFIHRFLFIAIPLTIYGGMGLLAQIFDAWLVNWTYGDLSVFAKFRYGARELPGALALAGAFSTGMLVIYRSNHELGLERIKQGSTKLMHVFFPLTGLLMLGSPYLFKVVFNADFMESAWIFNTYLLLMISRWVFPQVLLIVHKEHSALIRISLVELVLNVLLSVFFVRYFGLVGIAGATVIAYFAEKILLSYYIMNKYKISINDFIPVRTLVIYTLMSFTTYALSYWIW